MTASQNCLLRFDFSMLMYSSIAVFNCAISSIERFCTVSIEIKVILP